MCQVTYFQHKTCRHVWAAVTRPCAPYMGFLNCVSFRDDRTKDSPKFYKTESRPCPRCSGVPYDANAVRLVQRMGWGVKFGGDGPDEDNCGVDVKYLGCVVL